MQSIDRFGQLGDASPAFISVRDVPGDQGGKVALKWNASYLDAEPTDGIANYWIWRQAPSTSAEAAVRRGARWLDADLDRAAAQMTGDELGALAARGLYMRTSLDATQYAWEFVGSQPAAEFAQYSYVVPTIGDSTSGHNPYTPFLVQARSIVANAFWNAAPDSGYSVDNIAPATPAPFTGVYAGGSTLLDWGANHEADLAAYRLYRGSSAGFVPGPGNLVVETSSTQYTDAPGGPYVYKLAAVDLHGNVSPYALVVPSGTTDVGPTLPAVLALAPAFPNPARGSSTLDFALPREARVELALYDTGGRRVRTLVDATLPAGHHAARWDGRDDAGTLEPSGVYFVSMRSEGRELRRRLAFVR